MAKDSVKQNKLPEFLRPYFWDVDFDKVDLDCLQYFIIGRLLDWGNIRAVKWLLKKYSKTNIVHTVTISKNLSKRSATFWGLIFNIPHNRIASLQQTSHQKIFAYNN